MALLRDRVALVTGAGRGIGRAIALAFASEGAKVAISARTTAELEQVVAAIQSEGGKAVAFSADLSDRAAAAHLVAEVTKKLGPVEILVNNAGVGSSGDPRPVVEFNDAFWDLTLAVNLTAPYLLCKAVLPQMLARRNGRIITIASIAGKIGTLHGAAYSASKHGVLGLTRSLALEVAAQGITVNAICPGPVHTLMNDRRIEYDAQRLGVSFEQQAAADAARPPPGTRRDRPAGRLPGERRFRRRHRPGLQRLRRRAHGGIGGSACPEGFNSACERCSCS